MAMATANKKLVVVLGATGAQGNAVAKYLLAHSSHLYRIRAITRNASKPISIELKNLGAEVIEADFSHEASIAAALSGAWAVFAITNFWDQANFDLEVSQGKLVNKLASQIPELEHYVFSSLPDGRKLAGEKFQNILPYNAKAAIREDLVTYEGLRAKMTEVFVAYYYQNWSKYSAMLAPEKQEDGSWVMSVPFDGSIGIPMAWADDVGPYVEAVLKGGEKYKGKTVAVIGEIMGHREMLDIWSKQLGVNAVFKEVTPEEHVKRMKKSGLPDHIAVAVTELSQALVLEERVFRDEILANGKTPLPEGYIMKTWEEYVKEENWSELL